ncbi:MAG: DUF4129 domain-containing protein [Symbiobacteriia bacterium]
MACSTRAEAAAGIPDQTRLARIYNRPEFVWARWRQAFAEWLNALAKRLVDGLAAATGGNYAVLGWVGAAVIGVLALIGIIWLRRHLRGSPVLTSSGSRQTAVDPMELEAEAQRLAAAGHWADAIRQLLRAFLLQLDRRALLPFDPARTNREVARCLLPRHRTAAPELWRLLQAADEVTYGGRRASQPLWQEAEAGYRRALAVLVAGESEVRP